MKLKKAMIGLVAVAGIGLLSGCQWTNPDTGAGMAGYVYEEPVMFGKAHYIETQIGPTSTGLHWRYYVTNISITPYTVNEDFQVANGTAILSKDKMQISFSSHLVFSIDSSKIKELWEKYNSGFDSNGDAVLPIYRNYIQQQFRMISRDEVQRFNGFDVNDNIDPISQRITSRLKEYLKDTPFLIKQAVVGNIQYPAEVATAVSKKMATQQLLQQKQTEISITQAEAQKRVAEAHGIADAMAIINNQLTPIYLQHEAIQAQEKNLSGPNHTTEIYIPTGYNGVPIVGNLPLGEKK